jgi:hypothetical protein
VIAMATPGTRWRPPVVQLGAIRVTTLGQVREKGSEQCGLLDCWIYPLIGILLGGTLGAIGGIIAARRLEG